ncbi:MAG: winged helix-turn-helix domain-containing protein [Gammaproteobacteria bacterium]
MAMTTTETARLDLPNERLWRGGEEIRLTPKTFAVLRYLQAHPNRLITRAELLDKLWPGIYVTEAVIKDYIKELRKALGDSPDRPRYIETVHGRGYRYIGGLEINGLGSSASAAPEMALPPAAVRPSIAVLPFADFSANPQSDVSADAITESLITMLSKIPKLFVIARTSSFYYKGKSCTVKQVASELGVRYVLEGSVQRFGDKVRVIAQLIDASSGHHLWAEGYDSSIKDIFDLQDEIAWQVATELEVQLTQGEMVRVWRRETRHAGAYQRFLRAFELSQSFDPRALHQAVWLFQQAVTLDPRFASGWAFLADAYQSQVRFGWTADRAGTLAKAVDCAERALALDAGCIDAYSSLGDVFNLQGEREEGLVHLGKAAVLDPNSAHGMVNFANTLVYYSHRAPEALGWVEQALRLDPHPSAWYLSIAGAAYHSLDHPERAMALFEEALRREPQGKPITRNWLASAYANSGQVDKARAALAELLRIDPTWTISRYRQACPVIDPAHYEPIVQGLRRTGLPE